MFYVSQLKHGHVIWTVRLWKGDDGPDVEKEGLKYTSQDGSGSSLANQYGTSTYDAHTQSTLSQWRL